ncbi:MAG TPA: ACT domain-containing protein [Thermodesulfobacteriota bacterium]|nr:ACT domain-containing protein [Thermodesulfobacteriota bacterium]
MAHQISVFVENKPGRIERVTEILMKAKVNIRAVTVMGTYEYGVMKLLVDKPDAAYEALKAGGITAYRREIIAILMDDQPGGLNRVSKVLSQRKINIDDAYGFVIEDKKRAVLVVDVEKIQEAESILKEEGLTTLSDEEIYSL